MANNGIDEFGCFTLMVGLRENQSLRNIVLDGNPLGVQVPYFYVTQCNSSNVSSRFDSSTIVRQKVS